MKKSFISLTTVLMVAVLAGFLFMFTGCSGKKKSTQYPGRLKPGSAEFILNEGIFYLNSGNLNMAEKKLLKALKKKPTMVAAINALGVVYLNKQDFKKAIKYFTQVVRTNPEYFDAYNYLGVIYIEMGEYNLAKENLLVAANAKGYRTKENAYSNLAMLEIRRKKYDAALRYVDKGLLRNERFAPLSNLKGVILENRQKYKEALLWYKRAISLLTEPDVTFLVNIGRLYSKMGKKDKALDTLEQALGKAPTDRLKKQIRQLIADLDKK
jgi:tetratricopeptide (TPR) repeat protein